MKKFILTILILALIAQCAFAMSEEAQSATSEVDGDSEETQATEAPKPITTPEAPGAGISGSIMPFLSESFQTDLATGAATMTIPITVPPGRKNMQPNVALSYSSNNSNGICGVGWAIPMSAIQRSTKKGVPEYNDTEDTFIFAGGGSNAELVKINDTQYRAKIEGAFMKYTFNGTTWTVSDKSGAKYYFGQTPASRLQNEGNAFSWYLDKVEDTYGNYIIYTYNKPGDGQIYLNDIKYTGGPGLDTNKTIEFEYQPRDDKLYSYRTGWQIETSKRLKNIHVKLNGGLVWRYELYYGDASLYTGRSLLRSITVFDSTGASLPPKQFTYQRL